MTVARTVRWGIIGCGRIAGEFAKGLKFAPGASLAAVASRAREKADTFASEHGAARAHGDYESLATDPEVDIVYVATPHPAHCENTILCLENGKSVLCEKPFAVNRGEAEQMIAAAKKSGKFLMEAMWTRCFPLMHKVRELLKSGALGEPRMLQADFGFRTAFDPKGRLFSPDLAGGALLDVGVYPVSLAHMIFGKPDAVTGLAEIGPSGVDDQSAMVFRHGKGEISVLSTGVRTSTPQEAVILCAEGRIRIHSTWWRPSRMTVNAPGKPPESMEFPFEGNGYQFEAIEAANCLAAGRQESEILTWADSLDVMESMDTLRAQWGLRYPFEKS